MGCRRWALGGRTWLPNLKLFPPFTEENQLIVKPLGLTVNSGLGMAQPGITFSLKNSIHETGLK